MLGENRHGFLDQKHGHGQNSQLKMRSTKTNQMKSLQGHLGAEQIWSSLRTDSLKKLHVMDNKFPKELKEAVGAHVRDGLMNHKKPIFRNFVVTDDVPDLKQLMNQSHVKHIKTQRHKTQLMYQSSQINQDRSKILLFNNPLPHLSEDGIKKFLPAVGESTEYEQGLNKAIADHSQIDIDSEIQNLKPLNKKKNHQTRVLSPLGSDVSETLQEIWSAVLYQKESRKQPRYHFLTEKETTKLKGQFRQRFENLKTEPEHPKALNEYKAIEHNPSYSSEGRLNNSDLNEQQKQMESPWQPLSLQALVEYKEQRASEGHGAFRNGRPKMWKAAVEV